MRMAIFVKPKKPQCILSRGDHQWMNPVEWPSNKYEINVKVFAWEEIQGDQKQAISVNKKHITVCYMLIFHLFFDIYKTA